MSDIADLIGEERMTALETALADRKIDEVTTPDSAQDPTEGTPSTVTPEADQRVGANVDWSTYDIDYRILHMYPKANLRDDNGTPKWVVMQTEFNSSERSLGNYGKKRQEDGTPMNAGEFMQWAVNGPDGWAISGIVPASSGRVGVILERQRAYALPDPERLQTETVVPPVADTELDVQEAAAQAWMKSEGLTDGPEAGTIEV